MTLTLLEVMDSTCLAESSQLESLQLSGLLLQNFGPAPNCTINHPHPDPLREKLELFRVENLLLNSVNSYSSRWGSPVLGADTLLG